MGRTFDPKDGKSHEPLFYSSSIHDSQVHADARAKKLLAWGIIAVGLAGATYVTQTDNPVRNFVSQTMSTLKLTAGQ